MSENLALIHITYPSKFQPVEQTAAEELARLTGAPAKAASRPGNGLNVALAARGWAPAAERAAAAAA